ncbi:MAG: hypothetical protein FJW36_11080 [Acidobacteria bacterium]|nr:hypothetical protein [Acidobacteriota bacterium]
MKPLMFAAVFCGLIYAQVPHSDKRLVFSTFHGGDRDDDARAVAVDDEGFIYVAGETGSRDLQADPVGGKPFTAALNRSYLTKYKPGGKEVVWRKLIGGSALVIAQAMVIDRENNICITGMTGAKDLPMLKPIQSQHSGNNIAFVMKLSPAGNLLFSTDFGGRLQEEGRAMAVDSQNNLYIGGRYTSPDLPVKAAIQSRIGGGGADAFIAKFTPDHQLAYATYFGGTAGTDNIAAMAVGPDDSLYITGDNMSPGMATKDAWMQTPQAYSGYVAKLTPAGDAVTYFSYVGWRSGITTVRAIAVDREGQAYLAGNTSTKGLPTTQGVLQPVFAGGARDGFLLRLNAEATQINYLTYLGGSAPGTLDPSETVTAIGLDSHGHVYMTGETASPDFPGRREFQKTNAGLQDSFLMRIDPATNDVVFATFWGGRRKDAATALALGPGENATIVGESFSEDFSTSAATQPKLGSVNDAFVAQFCDPWLGANTPAGFEFMRGGEMPAVQEIAIWSGCNQAFEASEVVSSESWLKLTPDGKTVGMKLKLEIAPEGLEPSEYQAVIRVTVPEAFVRTIEIPVTLRMVDPPALPEPGSGRG